MPIRRHRLASALAVLLLAGCGGHPKGVAYADHAWIRLAAVPGQPAAAYMTIHGGSTPAELIAVDAKGVGSTELHETLNRSGADGGPAQMTMDRIDAIDIPPDMTVTLAPEDQHVMLFGVSPAIKPGTKLPLTLRLAKGAPLTVDARVIAAGDDAPY